VPAKNPCTRRRTLGGGKSRDQEMQEPMVSIIDKTSVPFEGASMKTSV